jgi:hypothetical protein
MAERRIGVACATRLPGLSHEAAAQGRRAPASLERRTRQATDEDKRAGELATRLVSSLPFAKCKGVPAVCRISPGPEFTKNAALSITKRRLLLQ